MSACEEGRRLSAYHDGELAPPERAAVEAHLRQCPACTAELARLRRLSAMLRATARPGMPPQALARLHRAVEDLAAADLGRVAKTIMAVAASILLICGIWLWQANGGVEPPGPIPVWETVASHRAPLATGSQEQLARWIVLDLERTNGHD